MHKLSLKVLLVLLALMAALPAVAQDSIETATPEDQALFLAECQVQRGMVVYSTTYIEPLDADRRADSVYTDVKDGFARLSLVGGRFTVRRQVSLLGQVKIDVGGLVCAAPYEWLDALEDMKAEAQAREDAAEASVSTEGATYLAPPMLIFHPGRHMVEIGQNFYLTEQGFSWRYVRQSGTDEVILEVLDGQGSGRDWVDRFDNPLQIEEGERLVYLRSEEDYEGDYVVFEVLEVR